MEAHQHHPKEKKGEQPEFLIGGPVFEFGPGWSVKTKKWFKKYVLGGKCTLCRTTRYVLLFGVILLLFGGPQLKSLLNWQEQEKDKIETVVKETVQQGDSKTKLARRALAEYLVKFPDLPVSNGQKVFVEEILQQKMTGQILSVGQQIEFSIADIKTAVEQSRALAPSTLQKWEEYAKRVRF